MILQMASAVLLSKWRLVLIASLLLFSIVSIVVMNVAGTDGHANESLAILSVSSVEHRKRMHLDMGLASPVPLLTVPVSLLTSFPSSTDLGAVLHRTSRFHQWFILDLHLVPQCRLRNHDHQQYSISTRLRLQDPRPRLQRQCHLIRQFHKPQTSPIDP